MALPTNTSTQLVARFGYQGLGLHGVQPQPGVTTAGGLLVAALQQATGAALYAVSFAARTDAGVRARQNLLSCRVRGSLDLNACRRRLAAQPMTGLYDVSLGVWPRRALARFMAVGKHYRYRIRPGAAPPETLAPHGDAWAIAPALDLQAMGTAAQCFTGTHDYSSFRHSRCSANNPIKTIHAIEITADSNDDVLVDVHGTSFLRQMVRILVGTLVEVGCGLRSPSRSRSLLRSHQRRLAGVSAPAHGLELVAVNCSQADNIQLVASLA